MTDWANHIDALLAFAILTILVLNLYRIKGKK